METVYISGPMSGLEAFNYPAFHAADLALQERGHATINPAATGPADAAKLNRQPDWHDYMVSAISRMRDATAICFLAGWRNSPGARIEAIVAEKMHLPEVKL
jgi:hypothetical protein